MTKISKATFLLGVLASFFWLQFAVTVQARSRTTKSLKWRETTRFPEPRSGYAAGIIGGKLVIAGGTYWTGTPGHWTKKLFSATTQAFDPLSERWEKLPNLPVPLGYPASAVVGNRLFVMGGYTGHKINRETFVLEKSGGRYSWSVLQEKSPARIFASAVSQGKLIYLVGGTRLFEAFDAAGTCCTSNTATKSLFVFNTKHPERGWQKLPSYPGKARWLSTVAINGNSIWLFGGLFQGSLKSPATRFRGVLRYNLQKQQWSAMPPMPKQVASGQPLCSLAHDNLIFLFTGHKQVWQFDLRTHLYTETTPMPKEVYVGGFFWLDHRMIGAGGESIPAGPRRRSPYTFMVQIFPAEN